jgi:hypothetical protein
MRARTTTAAVCVAILAGAGFAAPSDEASGADLPTILGIPAPSAPAFSPWYMSRVVSARVRHTRLRPVRRSNARRIGRSLASLRPTWVTGTLRLARNNYPKRDEVRAWEEIRRIVRQGNPHVQFDIVLNALQFRTPAAIERAMRRIRVKLHPEGWFFDFFNASFYRHPRMVKAAIGAAHANGEWIGGNIFGIAKTRKLPARADFYSVQDHVFHLNLPAVRRLAEQKPVLYHLNSNPDHPRSGGCRFIQRFNTKQRRSLIQRRAAQQAKYGFRVSYPALFPQCAISRGKGKGRFLRAYNAFRDPPMAAEIAAQLDGNDFDPTS